VARDFGWHIRRERRRAGLYVAHPLVNRRQLGPHVDGKNVHEFTPGLPGAPLGVVDQSATDSLALLGRIHGEQSEIGAIAAQFEIDTPDKLARSFREQKCSGLKHSFDLIAVDPVAVNEESLHPEGEIHQRDDLLDVGSCSGADFHGKYGNAWKLALNGKSMMARDMKEYSQMDGPNPILCLQMAGESG